jgi:SagB-type dehydrogenase family enzyme
MTTNEKNLNKLLENAQRSYNGAKTPEILVLLTSKLSRLSSKYKSFAYSLSLKHTGIIFQTLYLTAFAMGIAACAIDGGDSDLFENISKIDYYEEALIGEFIIGLS